MNFSGQKLKLRFFLKSIFFIISGVLVTYVVSEKLSSADYLNLDVKFTTPLLLIPFSFACYILSVLLRGLRHARLAAWVVFLAMVIKFSITLPVHSADHTCRFASLALPLGDSCSIPERSKKFLKHLENI